MVAQGAHASVTAVLDMDTRSPTLAMWLESGQPKICVYVNSEAELIAIHEAAKAARLPTSLITDSGYTEFHGVPTKTAVAVGPAKVAEVDKITGNLPLL